MHTSSPLPRYSDVYPSTRVSTSACAAPGAHSLHYLPRVAMTVVYCSRGSSANLQALIFSDIVKRGASLYRFGRQCQPFTSPLQPTSHVSHKLVMEGLACVCSYFYISFNLREYAGAVTHSREV